MLSGKLKYMPLLKCISNLFSLTIEKHLLEVMAKNPTFVEKVVDEYAKKKITGLVDLWKKYNKISNSSLLTIVIHNKFAYIQ